MEVILLEKVRRLGNLGDKVKVAAGFGRNFLIPYGKAVPATKANLEQFEQRRAELEKAQADTLAQAQARAERLEGKEFRLASKAGDEGKLFGSIGIRDVADVITASGEAVTKAEVKMPEGPIRNIGQYEISLQLHSDVNATITLVVVGE